jgi:Tfp pilus assembly protein PilF
LIALLLCIVSFQVKAQTAGSAHYDLGVFAYEERNFQAAETHFKKALNADPENPSANHYMGKTLMAQDRFDEAETYVKAAWKKDPDLSGLAYDRAFLYYKRGDYGKGADLFTDLLKVEPDHVLANFYGGVCLYRNGRYQEANSYLMSLAEKSPELKVKSYYYSGLCHYYLGQDYEAIQKLTFVQTNSDSSDVETNAKKWLARIKEGKKPAKPYALDVRLAYAYDDNVPLDSTKAGDYSPSEEDDFVVLGHVSGRYKVVDQRDWILGLGAGRSQSWYFEVDEFNMSETAGELYGNYYANPFSYGLSFRPILYQVDEEDFLLVYEANPHIAYTFSKDLMSRFSYTYSANDYRQDDYNDRDGSNHEGFLDAVYYLSGEKGYVLGGVGYELNSASEAEFDYGRIKVRLGVSLELEWELRLLIMGNFSNKNYTKKDPVEDEKRQDNRYEWAVSLSRNLYYDWLRMALEFTYAQNDSNYEDYEYMRQTAGIAFAASF